MRDKKIKRPPSAMVLYYLDNREEIIERAGNDHTKYLKVAAEVWKTEVSDEVK